MNDRGVELAEVVDARGSHDTGEFGGHLLHPFGDGVGPVPQERHQVTAHGDCIGTYPIGTYRIRRRFRDADYDLTIRNTGRGGKVFIPYKPGKQTLEVEV